MVKLEFSPRDRRPAEGIIRHIWFSFIGAILVLAWTLGRVEGLKAADEAPLEKLQPMNIAPNSIVPGWANSQLKITDFFMPDNMRHDVKERFERAWKLANPMQWQPYVDVTIDRIEYDRARPLDGPQFIAREEDLSVSVINGSLSGFFGAKQAISSKGKRLDLTQTFQIATAGSGRCYTSLDPERKHPMHEHCPLFMVVFTQSHDRYIILPEYGGLASFENWTTPPSND